MQELSEHERKTSISALARNLHSAGDHSGMLECRDSSERAWRFNRMLHALAIDLRLHNCKIDGLILDTDINCDDISTLDAVRITGDKARA